jgi:hypothetical protein
MEKEKNKKSEVSKDLSSFISNARIIQSNKKGNVLGKDLLLLNSVNHNKTDNKNNSSRKVSNASDDEEMKHLSSSSNNQKVRRVKSNEHMKY